MAKACLTFDAVRKIGLTLPDVIESTMYGSPALKVRGNLLACLPINKSAEPNCAVVRIDFDLRAALINENPETYCVTDHYAGYAIVLARLSGIDTKELRDLLGLAWSFVSSKTPAGRTEAKERRARPGSQIAGRDKRASAKPKGRRK